MTTRSNTRIWRGALAVVLVALLVLAWTQRGHFAPVGVGSTVPAYTAKRLDGTDVSLESLRGKVVVLNVWATWCGPCRQEMPALEKLQERFAGQDLEIVAVSVDAPIGTVGSSGRVGGDVRGYVEEMGLSFTILTDPSRSIEQLFLVQGLPTTFIIDKDGRIDQKIVGARAWDDETYAQYFAELLRS